MNNPSTTNADLSTSLAASLAIRIRQQIESGELAIGEKLASLRDYAQMLGCAKNTVVKAYEMLVADGLVEPRRGSGYFVTGILHPPVPKRGMHARWTPALMHELIGMGLQDMNAPLPFLSISEGLPPSEWLESCRLDRYMQKIGRAGLGTAFRSGDPMGYLPLRHQISRRLKEQGIHADADQIILTQGAYQAVDFIIRHFVRPGEKVMVEEPGFHPTFHKLRLQGAHLIGIPRLATGPDVAAIRRVLKTSKARLFFTQSLAHNPTGTDIAPSVCWELIALAREKGMIIVDDDALADFKPISSPRLAAFDQLHNTIHVGSFSKSLSSIVRVGYIVCSREYVNHLMHIKTVLSLNSSQFAERAVNSVITEGRFNRQVIQLQSHARRSTEHAIKTLRRLGATILYEPEQTLYLWIKLPGVKDSIDFARKLRADKGVVMAPGSIFCLDRMQGIPWFRVNVGHMSDPRVISTIKGRF